MSTGPSYGGVKPVDVGGQPVVGHHFRDRGSLAGGGGGSTLRTEKDKDFYSSSKYQ